MFRPRLCLICMCVAGALGLQGLAQTSAPGGDQSADQQPPIQTATITLTQDGTKFDAYLARPKTDQPAPGVLIVHEWWGLNDWVRQQADRLARAGYCALAVDLYHGEVATEAEKAHELMRGLPDERAVADLKAGFQYLARQEFARGKPIGVIGWCMGGGYALKLAVAEPKLACTVMCYGKPITDPEELKRVRGPLLGIWGADDRGIDVDSFRKALDKAGSKAAHHVFPGCGHAFMNENNPRGYDAAQAKKAWETIDAFLKQELRK